MIPNSLLVGLTVLVTVSPWMVLVAVAGAVEVNTLDLPPVVSADTFAW